MEVLSFYWTDNRSEDLHLMRGRSDPVDLSQLLRVKYKETPTSAVQDQGWTDFVNGTPTTIGHPLATLTFKPTFQAVQDPATNEYAGFGVRVHAHSGLVSVGANPAPQALYNFTVRVTLIADTTDAAVPRKYAYLRIHLHNYVAKAWLSPSSMRVPKHNGGQTFSIFAQFDDKTIGRLQASNVMDWDSVPPGKLDNISGIINLHDSDADDSLINVTATLTVEFKDGGGGEVKALGAIVPYTLPQVAHLIPGSAGYDQRDQVPNFIFLADGFQAGDQPRFNAMIDLFMRELRQNDKFKPFDRLVGRMNFWKAFVPSAARGIGTKFEVFGDGHASPISVLDAAFDPDNDSPTSESDLNNGEWGANQVRLYFGLPLLPHKGMSPGDIRGYWKQISSLPADLIDKVSDGLINDWKKQGDRRLVDESDTFLGTYYGPPTRAKAFPGENRTVKRTTFQMNEQRLPRGRLNTFLRTLQYKDENDVLHPLGPLWDMFAAPPDGRDKPYVIILVYANSGRSHNEGQGIYANVTADEREYLGIEADAVVNTGFPDGRAVKMADLAADRLPADLPLIPGKTTLLHEISHSLGLDDEYGEIGIAGDNPLLQYTGTGDIGTDEHFSNIQVKSDLILSPPVDGTDAEIDAMKIKWRWHRIASSGVLAAVVPPAPAAITLNGSQYTIKLQPGQAAAFEHSATVILRRRRQGEAILKDIEYSQVSAPRYPFVTRSPELAVSSVDAAADQVVVEAVNAGDLSGHDLIVDFPAECVLYEPLPARYDFPPTGENLELIAANILEFMVGTRRPVHENMDSHGQPELDFDSEQSPDLSDPDLAAIAGIAGCAKKNRDIVALYAGGDLYHHGVYHATGHCIMRDNRQIAEFCAVCKYILTDFIDPSLHPDVDKQFDEHYPLKAP